MTEESDDENADVSSKTLTHGLVAVLKTVQELCRSFYGVTAVTAESYGCVWHLQQRYAGDDVLELPE